MEQQDTFVLAAQIAASLHFATRVAKQLSLTAKNAHAISARAGQQSAGFRAITSYIEELAEKTISQSELINREAIAMATLASERERTNRALEQFKRAIAMAPDARYIHSVEASCTRTQKWLDSINHDFSDKILKLYGQLQDTQQQIRAAAIIASSSKIEATFAGSFQSQLEVIAQNINSSSDEIRGHLNQAQKLINIAMDNLGDRVYMR